MELPLNPDIWQYMFANWGWYAGKVVYGKRPRCLKDLFRFPTYLLITSVCSVESRYLNIPQL